MTRPRCELHHARRRAFASHVLELNEGGEHYTALACRRHVLEARREQWAELVSVRPLRRWRAEQLELLEAEALALELAGVDLRARSVAELGAAVERLAGEA